MRLMLLRIGMVWRRSCRFVVVAAVCVLSGSALAAENDVVTIDDPELNARYQAMIQQVRCLVCENRSIAESPSDVAQDLKKVIRDMILDGSSDAEITGFLAARYGDSILYRPPVQPNTWLLWGGPVLLLLLGGVVFARIVRLRMNAPIDLEDDDFEDRHREEGSPEERSLEEDDCA